MATTDAMNRPEEGSAAPAIVPVTREELARLLADSQVQLFRSQGLDEEDTRALLEKGGNWVAYSEFSALSDAELLQSVLLEGFIGDKHWQMIAEEKKKALKKSKLQTPQAKPMQALEELRARHQQMAQKNQQNAAGGAGREKDVPNAIEQYKQAREVQMQQAAEEDRNAKILITINDKGMKAKLKLTLPREGGRAPTGDEIREALAREGIVYGIEEDFIDRIEQFPVYGRTFCIAKGKPQVDGVDGSVKFYFETQYTVQPKINADGTADFKEIHFVKNVIAGDLLCELIPPKPSVEGVDVQGKPILGYQGKEAKMPPGTNTELSMDGSRLIAACDGQPVLKGGKVSVNQVLTVLQVGPNTGNITFLGSVIVQDGISSGFSVTAGGDITVKGFVENATLTAGGNVVLLKGMNGGMNGAINAEGSVRSLFLEHVDVKAAHHVYADVVLNCNIECESRVILSGSKGCMIGGFCRARKELSLSDLGNTLGLATRVEVRDALAFSDELERSQAELQRARTTAQRLGRMARMLVEADLPDDSRCAGVLRAVFVSQRLAKEINQMLAHIREVQEKLDAGEDAGEVLVYGRLFTNVTIELGGVSMRSAEMRQACAVRRRGGKFVFDNPPPRQLQKED